MVQGLRQPSSPYTGLPSEETVSCGSVPLGSLHIYTYLYILVHMNTCMYIRKYDGVFVSNLFVDMYIHAPGL